MSIENYTIGMAGHIDHGKTTLTKALTNVDTDRLKEEKERNISIELGYAPLDLGNGITSSIIDVPGHIKFIRQMIAGASGIDLVIVVIAADEGVMPQTREHIEILSFLGIENGIIAVTKADRVDAEMKELVMLDIKEELFGTPFETSEIVFVDSLSGTGIEELRQKILRFLPQLAKRNAHAPFRMPIDQTFTLKGVGTIVRGTVMEGKLTEGQVIKVKPQDLEVRARRLQVHNQNVKEVFAGQRAAINITDVTLEDVKRGDVLSVNNALMSTKTIDVLVNLVKDITLTVKQRGSIKFNTGTKEVMGQIVFFDRKDLLDGETEQILCQIRLSEPIAILRGDKFIIRRPSPSETIGGGWIIDPNGSKYKFGSETIRRLKDKMDESPEEGIIKILEIYALLTIQQITEQSGIPQTSVKIILENLINSKIIQKLDNYYVLTAIFHDATDRIIATLSTYHHNNSMRIGMNKAELIQIHEMAYPTQLIEYLIDEGICHKKFLKNKQYIYLSDFRPAYPANWKKRFENVEGLLKDDGFKLKAFEEYLTIQAVPLELFNELKHFLLQTKKAISLDDKYLLDYGVFLNALKKLYNETNHLTPFTLQDAKQALDISRKYLVLLLEMLDRENITKRNEEGREWMQDEIIKYI